MSSNSQSISSRRRYLNGTDSVKQGMERICWCGLIAQLSVSWSENNPGRRFYSCRNWKRHGCNFFEWHDGKMNDRAIYVINELRSQLKNSGRDANDCRWLGSEDMHVEEDAVAGLSIELQREREKSFKYKMLVIMLLFLMVVMLGLIAFV